MNLKLAIASTLLAIAIPASALAAVPPGKVSSVTFALVITNYEENTKVSPSTDKLEKSIYTSKTTKAKYGNKELIADLIAKTTLTGGVNDWSLKYVESDVAEFSDFFAVNKTGAVVYLGSDVFDYEPNGGYAYTATETETTNKVANVPTLYTQTGSYQETDKVEITLQPRAGVEIVAAAFHNYGESYKYVQQKPSNVVTTDTYSLKASSFTSLVGSNINSPYDGLYSGSINISAAKDTADVSAYYNALPN
jgi:hypothetical protein